MEKKIEEEKYKEMWERRMGGGRGTLSEKETLTITVYILPTLYLPSDHELCQLCGLGE